MSKGISETAIIWVLIISVVIGTSTYYFIKKPTPTPNVTTTTITTPETTTTTLTTTTSETTIPSTTETTATGGEDEGEGEEETTTIITTTTILAEEPCTKEGNYCPTDWTDLDDVTGFCIGKEYYDEHKDWFKDLTDNYNCGNDYCCIACANDDCCWGLRGYCYSFNETSPTGCFADRDIVSGYSYKCSEMDGDNCTFDTTGFYLIDPETEPPYGIKCVAFNPPETTTITTSTGTTTTGETTTIGITSTSTTTTTSTTTISTTTSTTSTSSTSTTTTSTTTTGPITTRIHGGGGKWPAILLGFGYTGIIAILIAVIAVIAVYGGFKYLVKRS